MGKHGGAFIIIVREYHPMVEESLVTFTATLSLALGAVAGVLALLTYEVFRRSPYGRAVFVLLAVFAVFVLYHSVILLYPRQSILAKVFESVMMTGVALFVWILVWQQRSVQPSGKAGG